MSPPRSFRPHDVLALTPFGPLTLGFDMPPGAAGIDDIQMALALERCEPLLCALEDWLGVPIDPVPQRPTQLAVMTGLSGMVSAEALAPVGTTCCLPWEAVVQRPPPDALLAPAMQWPSLHCDLEIASYAARSLAAAELRHGSLLLLPASFDARWTVHAIEPCSGQRVSFQWHPGSGCLQPCDAAAQACADDWRVVTDDGVAVPAETVFGWHAGGTAQARAVRARLVDAEGCLRAAGHIVPALRGSALRIDLLACDVNDGPSQASA